MNKEVCAIDIPPSRRIFPFKHHDLTKARKRIVEQTSVGLIGVYDYTDFHDPNLQSPEARVASHCKDRLGVMFGISSTKRFESDEWT
jgi:hypothetical protein